MNLSKGLTQAQEKVLKSLLDYVAVYHPKTPNAYECHEVTLGNLIKLWIKPNGTIIAVRSNRRY